MDGILVYCLSLQINIHVFIFYLQKETVQREWWLVYLSLFLYTIGFNQQRH